MSKHTFHVMYNPNRQNIKFTGTEERVVALARIMSAENRVFVTAETKDTSVATIPARATFAATRIAIAKMLDAEGGE